MPGLEEAQRQIHTRADLSRTDADDVLVDLDRTRVQTEPKVDDSKQPLTLDVLGLHAQRQLELFLGLADAVVLQQLAAAVQMKQKIFAIEGRRRWPFRVGRRTAHRARRGRSRREARTPRWRSGCKARPARDWASVETLRVVTAFRHV